MRRAAALALPAVVAVAALARMAPPPARGADTPAAEFSAERALATVRALVGDGTPRAVGTPADRRGADLVADRFRALGLQTSVRETFACGPYGSCATVRNVLARLGG